MPKVTTPEDSDLPLIGPALTAADTGALPRLVCILCRAIILAVLYIGTPTCMALAVVGAHNTIAARQDVVTYSKAPMCTDGRTHDCLLVQSSTISKVEPSSSGGNPTTHVYLRIPGVSAIEETIVDESTGNALKPGDVVTTTRWNGPTVLIVADGLRLTTEAGPQNRADKQEAIALGGALAAVVLLRIVGWRWFGRRVDSARFRRIDLIAVPAIAVSVAAMYLADAYTTGFWAISAGLVGVLLSSTLLPYAPWTRRSR